MSPPLSLSDPDAARVRSYADDIVTRLIDGYGCDNTSLSIWRSFLRPCDPDEQEINKEFTRVLKVILTDAAYESNPTVADADALSTWFQERSGEGRRAAH